MTPSGSSGQVKRESEDGRRAGLAARGRDGLRRMVSRFGFKLVAGMLLIAIIPLAVSSLLIDQVISVSDSVAEGQARYFAQPLSRAAQTYRGLFATLKQQYRLQADSVARDAQLRALVQRPRGTERREAIERRLRVLMKTQGDIGQIRLVDRQGFEIIALRGSDAGAPGRGRQFPLVRRVTEQVSAQMTFVAPAALFDDFRALGKAERRAKEITSIRGALAGFYRVSFLLMFGVALLLATAVGLIIARQTVRRVGLLVGATRRVADGDLDTQVELKVRDEFGELATSFNEMVGQLRESRERIAYLEKIGAWQEVARRLAHQVKNPLTPIQLAVQQLHRGYSGEDAQFRRLLEDARDIVTEEVEGLRRLVGAFSAFAKLPTVKPEPVELNSAVDDFLKSHAELAEHAQIGWDPLAESCVVRLDRMLFKHVLFNLVDNAVQAAQGAGLADRLAVSISCRRRRGAREVILTVEDNGPGMSEETRERAFDPYFTTKDSGTGLGLAVVKKIVLEHQGVISVHAAPRGGTRFTLLLPLV